MKEGFRIIKGGMTIHQYKVITAYYMKNYPSYVGIIVNHYKDSG